MKPVTEFQKAAETIPKGLSSITRSFRKKNTPIGSHDNQSQQCQQNRIKKCEACSVMLDYLKYYHQEQFLFEEVHCRFHQNHCIGAFDFFSIIIWKANRAKSKVAKRLQEKSIERNLDKIVRELTSSIYEASDHRERMRKLVIDWGFKLPMASAILTVFWPDDFTVYDVRACEQIEELLGIQFQKLVNKTNPESIWNGYCEYLEAVRKIAPQDLSLRDKDRYLWARSAAKQLDRQIEDGF